MENNNPKSCKRLFSEVEMSIYWSRGENQMISNKYYTMFFVFM